MATNRESQISTGCWFEFIFAGATKPLMQNFFFYLYATSARRHKEHSHRRSTVQHDDFFPNGPIGRISLKTCEDNSVQLSSQ